MTTELKNVLKMAIDFEKESYEFYSGLKEKVKNRILIGILDELARAETGHRAKLEKLSRDYAEHGNEMFERLEPRTVEDLKLADYLLPIKIDEGSSFQDVLIIAMHREGKANELYLNMLKLARSPESRDLFVFLAQEELEHKNIIEKLYEEQVYTWF